MEQNMAFADALIARSRAAQKILETYSQEQIDTMVKMFAKVVYDNAAPLAKLACEESKMGVYEDKVAKNKGKSRMIYQFLKDKKSIGILASYPDQGLVEVAKPIGVVAAITPCTNPVVTPMCNAMFAVKCANSVIVCPHPRGVAVAKRLKELYDAELVKMGVPTDIFLVVEEPTTDLSKTIMEKSDIAIATGGGAMVKVAYSSGKPALGVGPGNVQCLFDREIDLEAEVAKAIAGRIFDNGIICACEQSLIVPRELFGQVVAIAKNSGALYLDQKEDVDRIRSAVFPDGKMNGKLVGQSPDKILAAAGLTNPGNVKVILVRPPKAANGDPLSKEKMCPLLCIYPYDTWEEAVDMALANLEMDGKGHTVAIHSNCQAHVEYAGLKLPVSRIVVNQICATSAGGSFMNGLNPTTTLGCGSWGNNSISENLSYYHLMNRSRIAYVRPGWRQPADEEIWG